VYFVFAYSKLMQQPIYACLLNAFTCILIQTSKIKIKNKP